MKRKRLKFAVATTAVALFSGCYGAKIVKGPINSEHASRVADTIRVEQRELVARIRELEALLAAEREEHARQQARTSETLQELEESVRILVSRIEDSEQRMMNPGERARSAPSRPPAPAHEARADSAGAGSGVGGTAEELFGASYMDFTRGNHELAARGFQDYVARFPDGNRVAEAHYWLGECHYAAERFLEAVSEFELVVRDFPRSRIVPAAYLKMGRSYQQAEERGLAAKAFRTLIEKHPNTEEAKQAREALKQLEG